jgi:hypothetical protein
MQFLLALWVFHEPFLPAQQISFGFIWTGLLVFMLDAVWTYRRQAADHPPHLATLRCHMRSEPAAARRS